MAIRIPMDKKTFQSLDTCNPELAWRLIGKDALSELTGDDAIPVPFLGEAYTYDVLHMAVKEGGGLLESLKGHHTNMRVVGHVDNYLTEPPKGEKDNNNLYAVDQFGSCYSQVFQYSASHSEGASSYKEVSLQLRGSHRRTVKVRANGFKIDKVGPDLEKAKKVYIVMDAYCVTNLRMHIIVDGMEKVTVREGEHLPIGFTLDKFRLSDDGVLTPASKKASNQDRPWSSMKSREASQWARRSTVRNPRDPLPPAPSGMDEGVQKAAKRNPTDPLPAPPRQEIECYTVEERANLPLPPVPNDV